MKRKGIPVPPVVLTEEEQETLERWARRPKTAQALAQRARMILASAEGMTDGAVAAEVGVTRQTAGRWRRRFVAKRLDDCSTSHAPARPEPSPMPMWNA